MTIITFNITQMLSMFMRVYLLFLLLIPVQVGEEQRKLPLAVEEEE